MGRHYNGINNDNVIEFASSRTAVSPVKNDIAGVHKSGTWGWVFTTRRGVVWRVRRNKKMLLVVRPAVSCCAVRCTSVTVTWPHGLKSNIFDFSSVFFQPNFGKSIGREYFYESYEAVRKSHLKQSIPHLYNNYSVSLKTPQSFAFNLAQYIVFVQKKKKNKKTFLFSHFLTFETENNSLLHRTPTIASVIRRFVNYARLEYLCISYATVSYKKVTTTSNGKFRLSVKINHS